METLPELDLASWISALARMSSPHHDLARALCVIDCLQDRPTRMNCLLLGEPGTGKEGMARLLHRLMHPEGAPIEVVPTLGCTEDEIAGSLFGRPDAESPNAGGALGRNGTGTVVIEEILALSAPLQRRLTEAMRRLPRADLEASPSKKQGALIFALSDHNVSEAVANGHFRHDLYYKLARLALTLPPLRDRPEDTQRAALWMVNRVLRGRGQSRIAQLEGTPRQPGEGAVYLVCQDAIRALRAYPFPGNFRELEAVIERAVLLYSDGQRLCAKDVANAVDRPGLGVEI